MFRKTPSERGDIRAFHRHMRLTSITVKIAESGTIWTHSNEGFLTMVDMFKVPPSGLAALSLPMPEKPPSKHIRRAFDFHTPERLWAVFESYVQFCKENTIQRGKYAIDTPLTIQGFCRFSGIARSTFTKWRAGKHIPMGMNDTIEAISATIEDHLLARALISVYRENLVARMTGQSEKLDQQIVTEGDDDKADLSRLSHAQLCMLRALHVVMIGTGENPDCTLIIEAASSIIKESEKV